MDLLVSEILAEAPLLISTQPGGVDALREASSYAWFWRDLAWLKTVRPPVPLDDETILIGSKAVTSQDEHACTQAMTADSLTGNRW